MDVQGDISVSTVQEWLSSDTLLPFSTVEDRVLDSLFSLGYFSAAASISGDTLHLSSGEKFSLTEARILGDSLDLPQSLLGRLASLGSEPFDSWRIEASIQMLLSWCEDNGYPFAQIETDSLELDLSAATVTPHLKLMAGPRIGISFLKFQGNMISKSKLLERESRLQLGSAYNEARVQQARRRLAQLEYLREVSDASIVVDDEGKSGLLFNVSENRLSRLDLVAGLSPKGDGKAQAITGLIDLQFLNLFGTGRRGKVYWQRPSSRVQELAVSWREAWIFGSPLHTDLFFEQRVEDTLYVTRKYGVRLGYRVSATTEVFTGLQRHELLADSSTAAAFGFVTNQTLLYEIGMAVDTRDHSSNPRGGVRFETTAARGARTTDHPPQGSQETEFEQRRATVDVEVNREVLPFWIAHVSGHVRALYSDEPRIQTADKFRMGGARTLRGYREEQFLGEQIVWTNVEARYWLGASSRVAFFTDWGAAFNEVQQAEGQTQTSTVSGAYGLGLRLETGIGVWGIDYGVSTGSSPLNGQLHVSLLSLF